MDKALVNINPDLASSIALRYACRLAGLTGISLQTIHVVEPEQDSNVPGTGWVRKTWEKGLMESATLEISRLINAEKTLYRNLDLPRLIIGIPEDEILKELNRGTFTLYIEGALYSFEPSGLGKKLRSHLYREAPCSILLVKNLVSPDKIALIFKEASDVDSLTAFVSSFFPPSKIDLSLFYYNEQEQSSGENAVKTWLQNAEDILRRNGFSLSVKGMVKRASSGTSDSLENFGLVVYPYMGAKSLEQNELDLLNAIPSAILLYKKSE